MSNGHQGKGERARLDTGQIDGHEPETGCGDGGMDGLPDRVGDRPQHILHRQFQPGDLAVVTDPQVAESE